TTQPPEATTTQPPETTTTTQPPETTTTTQPPPETTTTRPPRSSTLPQVAHLDTLDEVPGISPYVTPISPRNEFYRIDVALTVPQVDPDNWRLRITGLVDNPYELTYQEIRAMPLADYAITLSCVSNPVGGGLVDNAVWTGIPLNVLLQRAGVQRGAQQIVGRSVDDFTAGFPTTAAYDGRNAILAIGMNNEPLPTRHGFPARIVVAGLYGYVSAVKWLEEIHLTSWEGFDGYWIPRGWSKRGPIKTQSRIDVPNRNSRLKVGVPTSIAGIAWAPTRGIRRVETKIDEQDWVQCELGEVLSNETWVQWRRPWTPDRHGTHLIQVRATDGTGTTQGRHRVHSKPNGAEGYHNVSVNVSR
ncbi:MAG: molybdopterin-dependent oxidoreductase, partial [Acidimicrobiaceae bacterium]|nr:molybdopterin-dependent oxidoreductase [Acidimicrobiaceae bacterium]